MTSQLSSEMFTKQVILHGTVYDLIAMRNLSTHWRWYSFLVQANSMLDRKRPTVDELEEAMKEAHFLANYHEHVPEDYPEDYTDDWQEIEMPHEFLQ